MFNLFSVIIIFIFRKLLLSYYHFCSCRQLEQFLMFKIVFTSCLGKFNCFVLFYKLGYWSFLFFRPLYIQKSWYSNAVMHLFVGEFRFIIDHIFCLIVCFFLKIFSNFVSLVYFNVILNEHIHTHTVLKYWVWCKKNAHTFAIHNKQTTTTTNT